MCIRDRPTDGEGLRATPGNEHVNSKATVVPELNAVLTLRENHAYAVGQNGVVMLFDGVEWVQVPSPTTKHLLALDGRMFKAVGEESTVVYYHWMHELRVSESARRIPGNLSALSNLAGCVFFGNELYDAGYGGGHAILLSPDNWHTYVHACSYI